MKSDTEIEEALCRIKGVEGSRYPGMTYEQGIEEALCWVIGEIPDKEFTPLMEG